MAFYHCFTLVVEHVFIINVELIARWFQASHGLFGVMDAFSVWVLAQLRLSDVDFPFDLVSVSDCDVVETLSFVMFRPCESFDRDVRDSTF